MTDRPRDWTFVLDLVLQRLAMYTGGETYERAVCFVIGFDQALGGSMDPMLNGLGSGSLWEHPRAVGRR